jgi:CRISPR-associated endonuclease Cas1
MREPVCPDLAAIYSRDPRNPSVLVADGYGLRVRVERGHLDIADGQGAHRRTRQLTRSQRTVRRLVLLGHTGSITLEAIRWCADTGVAITQIDADGRLLATLVPDQHVDPRLLRAQALAHATGHAQALAVELVDAKLAGQVAIAARLGSPDAVQAITAARDRLVSCRSVDEALRVEAAAAREYFGPWRELRLRFDRADEAKVPASWLRFDQRTSVLTAGHSPRMATSPINSLLNFCYAVAAAEARRACRAVGLDPTLGVLHADRKDGRDSLALDLLEPVRPVVDAYVLDLVRDHVFSRREVAETADGRCRLLAPLTHVLAEAAPVWARAVAPYAERVARELADAAEGKVRVRRPLTGRLRSSSAGAAAQMAPGLPDPNCPECGRPLGDRRRLRCSDCHQTERVRLAHERAAQTAARLTELDAMLPRPSGGVMRSARVAAQRAANAAWDTDHPDGVVDPEYFRREVLPGLQPVPIAVIGAAIGVGRDASWRIREGTLTPHRRHWETLASLAPKSAAVSTGR